MTMPTRHNCCKPFSRSIFLLLTWTMLLTTFVSIYVYIRFDINISAEVSHYLSYITTVLWALMPVAGWVGDSLLGRYRAIIIGFFLLSISFLVILSVCIILQFNWASIPAFLLLFVSQTMAVVGSGNVATNMLPFIIDQMIGASADDITAAVQWCFWTFSAGLLTRNLSVCINIAQVQKYILLAFGFLGLAVVLITDCLFHKWLDVHFKRGNPFKTIFRVINYARKTKYPEHRSALTYFDEEEPSRLDYGKHKFGGPFTEEEVEDVKTIVRLLPLVLSLAGAYIANNLMGQMDPFQIHTIPTTHDSFHCIIRLQHILFQFLVVLLIPVYQFIVYPLLHKHIPSLLKRIGAGLVLGIVGSLLDLTLDTVGHINSNNTQCMFDTPHPGSANTLSIPLYWPLISDIVIAFGAVLVSCTALEFVMAQTPNRMRGVMMGMAIMLLEFGSSINQGLQLLIGHFNNATPSCGFYYYLVLSILIILSLLLFTIAAKRYKLRERERHVNIQAIAEEHYERYLDQEEEYMREAANMYKTIPQVSK